MRKLIIAFVVLFLAVPVLAAQPETDDQKTLYALGALMSKQLSIFNLSVDEFEFVMQGAKDVVANKKLIADPEDYKQKIGVLAQTRMKDEAQKQKDLAKPYLEKAAKEKGAEKLASGLIYQQIKDGPGAKPKATDIVKVHYTGTFIDGKVFDSSVQRGEPVEFPLNKVIPCWTEGVGKMKVGGKAKLICPSDVAYRDQGQYDNMGKLVIPGGATLIFEVELLDVKAAPAQTTSKTPSKSKKSSKK